jgi:hypothetical protein
MVTQGHGVRAPASGRVGKVTGVALVLLVAAQAADYLTFLVMVEVHGLGAERNPVVAAIASEGLWLLTVAKAALVVLVASTFFVSRLRRPRVAQLMLAFAIVAGAIGSVSNIAAL